MTTHNDDMTARLMAHAQATADIIADYWNGNTENDDGDKATIYDWVADQLDIRVISQLDRNFIGCEIDVTVGGPYVYVDTREGAVIATDAGAHPVYVGLPREVVEGIEDVVLEYWNN